MNNRIYPKHILDQAIDRLESRLRLEKIKKKGRKIKKIIR